MAKLFVTWAQRLAEELDIPEKQAKELWGTFAGDDVLTPKPWIVIGLSIAGFVALLVLDLPVPYDRWGQAMGTGIFAGGLFIGFRMFAQNRYDDIVRTYRDGESNPQV